MHSEMRRALVSPAMHYSLFNTARCVAEALCCSRRCYRPTIDASDEAIAAPGGARVVRDRTEDKGRGVPGRQTSMR